MRGRYSMTRRRIGGLICILMVILLGMGAILTYSNKHLTQEEEPLQIGMVLYNGKDPFILQTASKLQDYIWTINKETASNLSLHIEDSEGNQKLQNDQINHFIEEGYDLLIVNMVERQDASMIIDKAQNANIPLIFFNREPVPQDIEKWNKVAYVGSRAEEAGALQGTVLADALDEGLLADKNKDGKIQYVMLEGEYGHQDAILRTYHCIKTLEARGYEMENLRTDTAMWDREVAKGKMEEWYTLLGDKIEVVLANNDEMALGAIEVLKEKGYFKDGKTIPVLGVDGLPAAYEAIMEGTLTGTVFNDSGEQALCMIYKACELLGIKLDEKYIPKTTTEGQYFWVKHSIVKKHTLESKK